MGDQFLENSGQGIVARSICASLIPKLQTLLIVFAAATLSACNSSKEKLIGTDQTQWRFQSYNCAFGCNPLLDGILKARIGDVLDFKSPKNGFDLFGECGGTLSLIENTLSKDELIKQLNQTVSPKQQFTEKTQA